ncbi:hypothetical protein ACFW6F_21865 [Streptomyces sp. NPDC058746]|uniref:hypothetical protein n=1 Tax=Streptomyces sp. NPDC058746 TaxID=3346622 RepID=UPI00368B0E6B
MDPEILTALVQDGGTAIVAAMATDAWQTTRPRVLELFRWLSPARQTRIEVQLDDDALLVAQDGDADDAREDLRPGWRRQLVALLNQHPEAADELQSLIDQINRALPQPQQNWVMNVTARDRAAAFGSQGGDVNVHYHAGSGYPQPPMPTPAADPITGNTQ